MKYEVVDVPAKIIEINHPLSAEGFKILQESDDFVSGNRYRYKVWTPGYTMRVAPTLTKVHEWLWGDWGPMYITWKEGLLCPFHDSVGTRNIRCLEGNCHRRTFTDITQQYVRHLDEDSQRRLIGRVVCYDWAHLLTLALYDIPFDWQLSLPDDPQLVVIKLLRRVYKESGYEDWWHELKRRKRGKPRSEWLRRVKVNVA
jgi:hypothetical protein